METAQPPKRKRHLLRNGAIVAVTLIVAFFTVIIMSSLVNCTQTGCGYLNDAPIQFIEPVTCTAQTNFTCTFQIVDGWSQPWTLEGAGIYEGGTLYTGACPKAALLPQDYQGNQDVPPVNYACTFSGLAHVLAGQSFQGYIIASGQFGTHYAYFTGTFG